MSKYTDKAKDSFKTKLELYLFSIAKTGKQPTMETFRTFKLHEELVHEFTNVYWQEYPDYEIDNKSIALIEKEITKLKEKHSALFKQFEKHYVEYEFPEIFPKLNFDKMLAAEKCFYCGISKQEIEELGAKHLLSKKTFRGWNFEIDRKKANYEYSEDNCVMSCYWCNNAKTDEFLAEEFKPIGELIGQTLRKRLNK